MDKISIIVPIFNSSKFLPKCINSLLAQTYQNIEIILVNDGSTDNSLAICQKFADADHRIRLVNQENNGIAAARNNGIAHATGDYLCFVDSDDFIDPDYCQSLIDIQKNSGADIVVTSFKYLIDDQYNVLTSPYPEDPQFDGIYTSEQWLSVAFPNMQLNVTNCMWSKLFRRNLFDSVRFPESLIVGEDTSIIWLLYLKANAIAFKNLSKYIYRRHSDEIVNSHNRWNAQLVKVMESKFALLSSIGYETSTLIPRFNRYLDLSIKESFSDGNVQVSENNSMLSSMIKRYN